MHFAPAELPKFVVELMERESVPAPYPLTFPAFPDAVGSVLSPIEPSGLNYWGPPNTESTEIDAVQLARGSQPVDQLDPFRLVLQVTPDAENRLAQMPVALKPHEMARRR